MEYLGFIANNVSINDCTKIMKQEPIKLLDRVRNAMLETALK
jgi:hypothetical protein